MDKKYKIIKLLSEKKYSLVNTLCTNDELNKIRDLYSDICDICSMSFESLLASNLISLSYNDDNIERLVIPPLPKLCHVIIDKKIGFEYLDLSECNQLTHLECNGLVCEIELPPTLKVIIFDVGIPNKFDFSKFKKLVLVSCSTNDNSFSIQNENLNTLKITNSTLDVLDVDCPKLAHIFMTNVTVNSYDFNNHVVDRIQYYNCHFKYIDISHYVNLKSVLIFESVIDNHKFDNRYMSSLYISGCGITDINLKSSINLTDVCLSRNNITYLDISMCKHIEYLSIFDNPLESYKLNANPQLKVKF